MSAPVAIEVQNLVKRFRREMLTRDWSTWKTLLFKPFQSRQRRDLITMLDGVSFAIEPSRTVAIIGQNGSGKSTLLKILAGIYKPDAGKVEVRGRVSSLIELGAGFHPDFSGRENVYLNGTILGLSKERNRRALRAHRSLLRPGRIHRRPGPGAHLQLGHVRGAQARGQDHLPGHPRPGRGGEVRRRDHLARRRLRGHPGTPPPGHPTPTARR